MKIWIEEATDGNVWGDCGGRLLEYEAGQILSHELSSLVPSRGWRGPQEEWVSGASVPYAQ
jgi:hypothetical protein